MAFETSCDETSVAVLKNDTELLSNVIASQIESHKRFGGVVPEVASRHHVEVITACIELELFWSVLLQPRPLHGPMGFL